MIKYNLSNIAKPLKLVRDAEEENNEGEIEEWSGADDGVSGDDEAYGAQDEEDGIAILVIGI